jgi:SAM-dependent methyltransferase
MHVSKLLQKINRGLRYRIMGKLFYYSSKAGSGVPNLWQKQIIHWNQSVNEKGWLMPYIYSKQNCLKFWQELGNQSPSTGNRPESYAKKDNRVMKYVTNFISADIDQKQRILEIGCNAGANLNVLFESGYESLEGIEINPMAIKQMQQSFPELASKTHIIPGGLDDVLPSLKDESFDLIFTMGVAMHIHPADNSVFKEMVRLTRQWICTIEPEEDNSNYVFARNYKRHFESIGMQEVRSTPLNNEVIPGIVQCKGSTIRLFKKLVLSNPK